jgi:hypothetical protein
MSDIGSRIQSSEVLRQETRWAILRLFCIRHSTLNKFSSSTAHGTRCEFACYYKVKSPYRTIGEGTDNLATLFRVTELVMVKAMA